MKKATLYRADDYEGQIGNLVGFYDDLEEAKMNVEYKNHGSPESRPHSQITAFRVESELASTLNLSDNKRMLAEDVWGSGEIVCDFYYK